MPNIDVDIGPVEFTVEVANNSTSPNGGHSTVPSISRCPPLRVTSKLRESTHERTESNMNIEYQFIRRSIQTFGIERTSELFSTNGIEAVRDALLEDASDRVASRAGHAPSSDDLVDAFNSATAGWTHELRSHLAAYEASQERHDVERYNDETQTFAEKANVLDWESDMQTNLNAYYESSPYHDDELSDAEAELVLYIRTAEGGAVEDEQEIVQSVSDVQRFTDWYERVEDLDEALDAHEFDPDVPTNIATAADPPSEWDELTASSIETKTCHVCATQHYHVEKDGEPTWIKANDDTDGAKVVGPENEYVFLNDGPNNDGLMCDSCEQRWLNNATRCAVLSEDGVARLYSHNQIVKSRGGGSGWYQELSSESQRAISSVYGDESIPHMMQLSVSDGPAADDVVRDSIDSILAEGQESHDGPIVINERNTFEGTTYHIHAPRELPAVVRYAKELLEDPTGFRQEVTA